MMKDLSPTQEIRRRNFTLLVRQFRSNAEAAASLEMSEAQVSNYVHGSRKMGEKLAARIEKNAHLVPGTLSTNVSGRKTTNFADVNNLKSVSIGGSGTHKIESPRSSLVRSNVDSSNFDDFISVKRENESGGMESVMAVQKAWLEANGFDIDSLRSFPMPDNSQSGLIEQGYEVLYNKDVKGPFIEGKHYVVLLGGVMTVRRIEHQVNGDIILKCLSTSYSDQIVSASDIPNIKSCGIALEFRAAL